MECAFNQRDRQVTLQIPESEFIYKPGTVADQVSLGYQQFHAHAMRNFLAMPKEPQGENLRAIPHKEADKAALRKSAELAQCLGFESPEIATLKGYPHSTTGQLDIPYQSLYLSPAAMEKPRVNGAGFHASRLTQKIANSYTLTTSIVQATITAKVLRLSSSAGRCSLHSTAGTPGTT